MTPVSFHRPAWFPVILLILLALFAGSCRTTKADLSHMGKKKLTQEEQMQLTALFIDANREKALGNEDKAMGLFATCIKRDPTYAPAMYEMARVFDQELNGL